MKILIIDDHIHFLENVAELLKMEGFQTMTAIDGNTGVQIALSEIPDLILCDIKMPEMDGFQVQKIIKQHPLTRHIPFVFITACAQVTDVAEINKSQASAYLLKPFEYAALLQVVNNCLQPVLTAICDQELPSAFRYPYPFIAHTHLPVFSYATRR